MTEGAPLLVATIGMSPARFWGETPRCYREGDFLYLRSIALGRGTPVGKCPVSAAGRRLGLLEDSMMFTLLLMMLAVICLPMVVAALFRRLPFVLMLAGAIWLLHHF
jgi:hypothetical protein